MLIPGTHDSGTYGINNAVSQYSKCQDLNLRDQLNAGVRFIDIRVKYCNDNHDSMCVFHASAYTNLNFDNVLDQRMGIFLLALRW